MNINLEINRPARSINSLIGGGEVCKNKMADLPLPQTPQIREKKKRSDSKKLISTNPLTKSFAVYQVRPKVSDIFDRNPQERPRVRDRRGENRRKHKLLYAVTTSCNKSGQYKT